MPVQFSVSNSPGIVSSIEGIVSKGFDLLVVVEKRKSGAFQRNQQHSKQFKNSVLIAESINEMPTMVPG